MTHAYELIVDLLSLLNIRHIITILALAIFSACPSRESYLADTYTGFWYETKFEYSFKQTGEFEFVTNGHFGNTVTNGRYAVIDSVILLHPYTDWTLYHGVLKTRFLLKKGTGCIRDYENHYYCNNINQLNTISSKNSQLMDSIEQRLFDLEEVKKITNKYPDYSRFHPKHPRFSCRGILLINNMEFHSLKLRVVNEGEDRLSRPYKYFPGTDYLINLEENVIFQHHSFTDSISFVDELFMN